MERGSGRRGRPFRDAAEAELFRIAFREAWEEVMRASLGVGTPGDVSRWEAVLELSRRALSAPPARPEPVRCAADLFRRFRFRFSGDRVENFLVLLLDPANRPVREVRVSTGILTASLVHPREVFAPALEERAAAVLLVHNHPAGDPAPSAEDREVTRRLRSAGGIVGIPVLDHVIIGDCSYFSFREDGDW